MKSVQPPTSPILTAHTILIQLVAAGEGYGYIMSNIKGILSCVVRVVTKPAKIGDNFSS